MINLIAIACGAGVASALLFAVTLKGTAIAMALAYLSPLPIMIATLGWGLEADAIAMIVASAGVAGLIDPGSGLMFALTVALPAGLVSGLAIVDRLDPFDRGSPPQRPYRAGLGTLTLVAAGVGFVVSSGAMATLIVVQGGFRNAIDAFRAMLQPSLEGAATNGVALPDGLTVEDIARLILAYAPAAIAASTTLMLVVNLYIAARTAQVSQRLPRPWPEAPTSLALPAVAAFVALAALIAWGLAPDPFNPFAAALAAPLALVFGLQGLAVLHALSRHAPGRPALLSALYLALFLAPRWVAPVVITIGLLESALKLRARIAQRAVDPRNRKP
ncbi:MAG: DUF2232 domain-containing protein [Roseiarcus sp.]